MPLMLLLTRQMACRPTLSLSAIAEAVWYPPDGQLCYGHQMVKLWIVERER